MIQTFADRRGHDVGRDSVEDEIDEDKQVDNSYPLNVGVGLIDTSGYQGVLCLEVHEVNKGYRNQSRLP